MAAKVTRFLIGEDGGFTRQLFSVVEKKNGDLIIPINAADRFVANGVEKLVREHRYSIHTSSRSLDYTTIKQTIELEGDERISTVSLTDAIKKKNGFSIIYVRRCQNFMNENYPATFTRRSTDEIYTLPPYDPTTFTLFHGLYVGHPEIEFNAADENTIISPFKFRKFQLIVFVSLEVYPSADFSEFLHAITTPPELTTSSLGQEILRYLMTGRTPENCIRQYRNSVQLLTKRFLTRMLPLLTEPDIIEKVKAHIASIPDVTLNGLELDSAPHFIHLLTDPKPHNP